MLPYPKPKFALRKHTHTCGRAHTRYVCGTTQLYRIIKGMIIGVHLYCWSLSVAFYCMPVSALPFHLLRPYKQGSQWPSFIPWTQIETDIIYQSNNNNLTTIPLQEMCLLTLNHTVLQPALCVISKVYYVYDLTPIVI